MSAVLVDYSSLKLKYIEMFDIQNKILFFEI